MQPDILAAACGMGGLFGGFLLGFFVRAMISRRRRRRALLAGRRSAVQPATWRLQPPSWQVDAA